MKKEIKFILIQKSEGNKKNKYGMLAQNFNRRANVAMMQNTSISTTELRIYLKNKKYLQHENSPLLHSKKRGQVYPRVGRLPFKVRL